MYCVSLGLLLFGATACTDEEGLDVTDVTVPSGYALSAGTA